MRHALVASTLCLVLAGVAAGQQGQQTTQPRPPAAQGAPDMKACQEAMARHGEMMKELQAMDTRLQEQLKAMQVAQGTAKVDAVARVVTMMAEQRTQERQRMMSMHEQMMSHMMSHMGQGAAAMQQCPMMQHATKPESQHQH